MSRTATASGLTGFDGCASCLTMPWPMLRRPRAPRGPVPSPTVTYLRGIPQAGPWSNNPREAWAPAISGGKPALGLTWDWLSGKPLPRWPEMNAAESTPTVGISGAPVGTSSGATLEWRNGAEGGGGGIAAGMLRSEQLLLPD